MKYTEQWDRRDDWREWLDEDTIHPRDSAEPPCGSDTDWESRLERQSGVRVFDYIHDSRKLLENTEQGIRMTSDAGTPQLPEPGRTRFFLIDGLSRLITAKIAALLYGQTTLDDFYRYHFLDEVPDGTQTPLLDCCFFAKWARPVVQTEEYWDIESRILKGHAHNLPSSTDPSKLYRDHMRFSHRDRVGRPLDTLEDRQSQNRSTEFRRDNVLRHATRENVSFYLKECSQGKGSVGILVFDKRRQYRIDKITYKRFGNVISSSRRFKDCFVNDISCLPRFVQALKHECAAMGPDGPEISMETVICRLILRDQFEVLALFHRALHGISMAMADDDLMRRELKHWRTFFGRWRRGLSQEGASIAYIRRWLMNRTDLNPDLAKHVSGLSAQFLELGKAIENANARSDSTFQALMSSMAIVESQKAIAQAEEISKLTSLAFFFIPLTLVATIFSMDVVEFDGKLKAWFWAVASVGVLTATYLIVFWDRVLSGTSRTADNISEALINAYFLLRRMALGLADVLVYVRRIPRNFPVLFVRNSAYARSKSTASWPYPGKEDMPGHVGEADRALMESGVGRSPHRSV